MVVHHRYVFCFLVGLILGRWKVSNFVSLLNCFVAVVVVLRDLLVHLLLVLLLPLLLVDVQQLLAAQQLHLVYRFRRLCFVCSCLLVRILLFILFDERVSFENDFVLLLFLNLSASKLETKVFGRRSLSLGLADCSVFGLEQE